MPIEISRRSFPCMKRTLTVLALFLAAVALVSTSCGSSDYIKSVQLNANGASAGGTFNLPGVDQDGAALPAYGANTVPISSSGLMSGIVGICTWEDAFNTTVTPNAYWNPPVWQISGWYQVTATYRNFTSEPLGVGVGVATSKTSPIGGCGP